MQQIERFGVIALVFLLVTIVAVSFWGEDEGKGFWSRFGRDEVPHATEVARRDPAMNAASTRRALGNEIPMTSRTAAQRNQAPGAGRQPVRQQPVRQQPVGRTHTTQRQAQRPTQSANQTRGPRGTNVAASPGSAAGAGVPARNLRGQRDPRRRAGQTQPVQNPAVASRQEARPERALAERVTQTPRTAPASTAQTNQQAPSAGFHVVESGDSLSVIAQKRLGSSQRWKEIQALNGGIAPERLSVGMKLQLPKGGTAAPVEERRLAPAPERKPERTPEPTPKLAGGSTHIVRSGQTLSQIAEDRLGRSSRWKEITALNPGVTPERLVVGKKLILPTDAVDKTRGALVADAGPSRERQTTQRRSGARVK
jgi:nucleoid-associated protein YgaU